MLRIPYKKYLLQKMLALYILKIYRAHFNFNFKKFDLENLLGRAVDLSLQRIS